MDDYPPLRSLALFLAVIDHGSMSSAASAVGITQPAISAQIRGLEQRYGARLLERGGHGSTPTAVGRLVAGYAARLLALSDELGRAVADVQGLRSGRLVIGASSTIGEQLLPAALGRFHAVHPGVAMSVRIGNSDEIIRFVAQGEIDLAFVGRPPEHDDLRSDPFFADAIVAFVAPGDPLLGDGPLSPAALSGRQFVLREPGSATRDLALGCLRRHGCAPGHLIELGSNEAVKRAVEARLGIGLLSTLAIEAERLSGLLEDLPLRPWRCDRVFWLIRRRDRSLTSRRGGVPGVHRARPTPTEKPTMLFTGQRRQPRPNRAPPCRRRRRGSRPSPRAGGAAGRARHRPAPGRAPAMPRR
jgi:DNA-binding transcriptional LysR family regulator